MKPIPIILIIISDRAFHGTRQDETVPKVETWCRDNNFVLEQSNIIPDDEQMIQETIWRAVDTGTARLIITSGGTGFSPKDLTPEVTAQIIERRTPGIDEFLRAEGLKETPYAVLSRGISGIIKDKLIINLPGNPNAVIENLDWLKKILPHALSLLNGVRNDNNHKFSSGN
jgi:molybdenum cofactor synthesis domain-containing protein